MSLMAEDLEAHDMQRLIHYFCPAHMMSNISLMDAEFDFSDEAIDMALRNWGFLYADAASQMDSLNQITEVLDFRIEEDAVYFDVILEDGSTATIYSYIDWETLCLYAAAG